MNAFLNSLPGLRVELSRGSTLGQDAAAPFAASQPLAFREADTPENEAMPDEEGLSPNLDQLEAVFHAVYDAHKAELEREFSGGYIVVNTRTGDYVIGSTPHAAMSSAERAYGTTDFCWSRRIGRW